MTEDKFFKWFAGLITFMVWVVACVSMHEHFVGRDGEWTGMWETGAWSLLSALNILYWGRGGERCHREG